MPTFGEMVVELIDEIDNLHEKHERFIRRSLLRALKNMRGETVDFMERQATFTTTVDTNGYVSSATGSLPAGIECIRFIGDEDTGVRCIERDLQWLKMYQRYPYTVTSTYAIPFYFVWVNDVIEREAGLDETADPPVTVTAIRGPGIEVAPTPAQERTFQIYYKADPARDENSGQLIEWQGNTDTAINDWLRVGEPALRARVLRDYYSTMSKDGEAASLMQAEYQGSMAELRRRYYQRQQGVQARHYF